MTVVDLCTSIKPEGAWTHDVISIPFYMSQDYIVDHYEELMKAVEEGYFG